MKKMWLLMIVAALVAQVTVAEAIVLGGSKARKGYERDLTNGKKAGGLLGVDETSAESRRNTESDLLLKVGKIGDQTAVREAISRKISVKEADGTIRVEDIAEIGRTVLARDQALRKIDRSKMSDKEKEDLTALEEFNEIGAQFLGLAAKTSTEAILLARPELQVARDAFNKQLSLLKDAETMDARELKSHTEIMRAAVQAKTNPNVKGENAYANALQQKYGAKAKEKMEEMISCVRG